MSLSSAEVTVDALCNNIEVDGNNLLPNGCSKKFTCLKASSQAKG